MRTCSLCVCLIAAVTVAAEPGPAGYAAERVGRTVGLTDTDRQVVVSIAPSRGNVTFEMRVKGHDVLHFPVASIEDLQDGALEVRTRIQNLRLEPMPVSIGFHPYFQLTDSPRDDWTIAVGARTQWLLAENKIPTGETHPIERLFPSPQAVVLKDYRLDHVFGDLVRDAHGRAVMSVKGRSQRLDVSVGANYRAVVIYAPGPDRSFICFEPMAGITNAMNAAHRGLYRELQSIPAGGIWEESFWVRPSGF